MTTICYPNQQSNTGRIVLALLLAVFAAASVHAVVRHGETAQQICDQLDRDGATMTMTNPVNGRTARVCTLGDRFCIAIFGRDGCNITAFAKEKMRHTKQVLQYLRNQGYR